MHKLKDNLSQYLGGNISHLARLGLTVRKYLFMLLTRNTSGLFTLLVITRTTYPLEIIFVYVSCFTCRCQLRCFDAFSSEQKTQIISRINECDNKNDQDSYLQCLIQYHAVERHRSRNKTTESTPKPKTYSYEYYVKVSGETVKVCKTAYINLHSVSKKRVERLQKLLVQDKLPKDQRGRSAGSRHNVIPGDIFLSIHDFIKSIPVHEVHYSDTKKYYFSSNLNMKILHNMFITKNPQSGVKYDFFVRYMHENFNIGFGQP